MTVIQTDKVQIVVEGKDKASPTFDKIGGRMDSLAGKATMLGGIALAGVGAAVAGIGLIMRETLGPAIDFESAIVNLGIAAGSTGLTYDELHDAALEVGGDIRLLGVDAVQAADSMTLLFKAGMSNTEVFGDLNAYMEGTAELGGALRASIDLAAASELNMVQASDLAAIVMATFGGNMESATERADFITAAMDNIVRAADASVAEVGDMAAAFSTLGPTATALGIPLDDVNTALAILSTRGISGAEAGTAVKSMLTNLQRPTKQVTEAWAELGIAMYDIEGNFRGMPNLIYDLEDAMKDMTQEQKNHYIQTLAGTYGMNALNTLLAEGKTGWEDMTEAIADATGIQEQASKKAETFAGRMEALEGAFETVKIKAGEMLLPAITDLVNLIAERGIPILEKLLPYWEMFTNWIAGLIERLPDFINWLGIVWDSIIEGKDAIMGLLNPIFEFIGSLISWQDVLIAIGIVIAAIVIPAIISLLISLAPLIIALGAIIGLVALFRRAWEEDWGGIRTKLTEAWEEHIRPALEALREWLEEKIPLAIEWLKGKWEELKEKMTTVWEWIDENIIQKYLIPLRDWLAEQIPLAIEACRKWWEEVFRPAMERVWMWIEANVIPVMEDIWEWLKTNIPEALEECRIWWEETFKPGLERVKLWIDGNLIPQFKTVWEWLKTNIPLALEMSREGWEEVLWPALREVWDMLANYVWPIIKDVVEIMALFLVPIVTMAGNAVKSYLTPAWIFLHYILENYIIPVLNFLWEWLKNEFFGGLENWRERLERLYDAWNWLKIILMAVHNWLRKVIDIIKKIPGSLPGWLTGHSPSPFEMTLIGINSALKELIPQLVTFNRLSNQVSIIDIGATRGGIAAGPGWATQTMSTIEYHLHSYGRETDTIRDFDLMQSIAGV